MKVRTLYPGDTVDLTIEKGVYRGLGLARQQGHVVFVPHALPGEKVRARVEKVARGYVNARLVELLAPSSDRRTSPCPYVPRCGGCTYQEMDYGAQLRLKESVLQETIERAGIELDRPIPVAPSPEQGWRTRAAFHLASGPSGLRLGLFEEGSHRLVDVDACLQVSPAMNRAARALLEALRARPHLAALVHGIELAESTSGEELVAALIVHADLAEASAAAALATEVPWLTGLGLAADRASDASFLLLRGEPYVHNRIDEIVFRSHVRSFFQANRFLAPALTTAVLDALAPGGTVLDLYSGVGLFSLAAAKRGMSVRSAESHPLAADDARANAAAAGLTGVRIDTIDVEQALTSWPRTTDETVIVDPPRTGLAPGALEALVGRGATAVVYVACDPPTLARDLARLLTAGYSVRNAQAFDMFPDTFHVETVVALARD